MAIQKTGINFSALGNISAPSFNFSSNAEQFIASVPTTANDVTNGFLGLIIMVPLFIFLVWKLGDLNELQGQTYSTLRNVGISAGIVGIVGLQMLNIGYFTEYYHVVIFLTICLISFLWIWKDER